MILVLKKSSNLLKSNNLYKSKIIVEYRLAVASLYFLFVSLNYCSSQSGFMFNEYFGADESASYGIIEHEGFIYATGTHQDDSIGLRGIYIAKFDAFGSIENHEVYYNEDETYLAQNLVYDVHVLNDNLYVVASSFIFNDKILQYDLNTDKIDSVISFDLFENQPTIIRSFTVFNNELVTVLNTSSPNNEKIIVQFGIGITSRRIIIDREGSTEAAHKIFNNNNDELIILNSLSSGSIWDSKINIIKINMEGEILFDHTLNQRSILAFDILEESDGSLVFPFLEVNSGSATRPRIIKIDENGEEVWQSSIGANLWCNGTFNLWKSMIKSNEGDGYVFAGRNTEKIDPDSILSSGVIGKISINGDSLWYKRFNVLDENIWYHLINDLEKSEDGYVASGELFYEIIVYDIPFRQSYFVKIDNDGNINADTTGTLELFEDEISSEINIYPNPSGDFFYVEQDNISEIKYQLYNLEGNLIKEFRLDSFNQVLLVSSIGLPRGTYYLKAYSEEKGSSTWPIIIN